MSDGEPGFSRGGLSDGGPRGWVWANAGGGVGAGVDDDLRSSVPDLVHPKPGTTQGAGRRSILNASRDMGSAQVGFGRDWTIWSGVGLGTGDQPQHSADANTGIGPGFCRDLSELLA